jgi:hypothetical protein
MHYNKKIRHYFKLYPREFAIQENLSVTEEVFGPKILLMSFKAVNRKMNIQLLGILGDKDIKGPT